MEPTTAITERPLEYHTPTGDMVKLTMQMVKKYLVQGYPELVTDQEIIYFMHICKSRKLNPFIKDCYLIKYSKSDTAAIVTSVDYFRKNAIKSSTCKGWNKGIIVRDDKGNIRHSKGIMYENESLMGGWFKAKPEGWDEPFELEVPLKPYIKKTKEGKVTQFWSEDKQSTMIAKVAEAQGLRALWGEESTSMYSPEEMPSLEDAMNGMATEQAQPDPVKTVQKEEEKEPDSKVDWVGTAIFNEIITSQDTKYLDEFITASAKANELTEKEVLEGARDNGTHFWQAFVLWREKIYPKEYAVKESKEKPKPSFVPDYTGRNAAMESDPEKRVKNNHQVQHHFTTVILPDFKGKIAQKYGTEQVSDAMDFIKFLSDKNSIPTEQYTEETLKPGNFKIFCSWFDKYLVELKKDQSKKNKNEIKTLLKKDPKQITDEEWEALWEHCKNLRHSGYPTFIFGNQPLIENAPIAFYNQCKEKWSQVNNITEPWTLKHHSEKETEKKVPLKNPLIGETIYQIIRNEEDMFPEIYKAAIEKFGEPKTVEDCESIHHFIDRMVDQQNDKN